MKTKTSRKDFRQDNSGLLAKVGSSNGKHKWESVKGEFLPSLSARDLEAGSVVEGKIVDIRDWKSKKTGDEGTKMVLRNGETEFEFPLYGGIAYRLAKFQGKKTLDRKAIVGKMVRFTYEGKNGKFQNFGVAIAK